MAKTATKTAKKTIKKTSEIKKAEPVVSVAPKKGNTKFTKYLVLAVFLGLILVALYLGRGVFIAATVNGKPISRLTIIKNLEKTGGKQALDSLVTKELISQEAKKQNIVVSDDDVKKEIDNLTETLKSQGSTLDAALATQGMTKEELEQNIKVQKTVEKLLASEIAVSDDDVKKYFEQNKATYGKDKKYEDLKDSIKSQLEQEKLSTEFQKWYQKLQSESNIKYFVSY